MNAVPPCPLCSAASSTLHYGGGERDFWHCGLCDLVFVAASARLPYKEEIARYRHHRNDERDSAYVDFLSRLAVPMIERTPVGACGVDYGSGPSPALAQIMERAGRPTVAYDPVFRAEVALVDGSYDFLTCSEVIEHVHDPMALLERFATLVKPGGIVGIMTTCRDPAQPFGEWWYARDPTHVCFYSEATMRWIAKRFGWEMEIPVPNVVILRVG
jgi:SAM-dependent methyltransferase